MFQKLKKWLSPSPESAPCHEYMDPITRAAIESGFNDDSAMQKDTEILERVLIARHGVWLLPHRCTSLSGGKDNLLRYRKWLPPVVITPVEKSVTDLKKSEIVFNIQNDLFFPGVDESNTKPGSLDRGMNASFNSAYDIFVNPVALDILLTGVIPITDPRYYRIFKEVSFDLCHKLADKTKVLFGGGQNGEFFPDYPLKLDSEGNVQSETFERVFARNPFKSPREFMSRRSDCSPP